MLEDSVREWMSKQTLSGVSDLLRDAVRSYVHPYGFNVHRIDVPQIRPLEARIHVWPSPVEIYGRMARNKTQSQIIHAHGWNLLTRVVRGVLEEATYNLEPYVQGEYGVYSAVGAAARQQSELRLVGRARRVDSTISVRTPNSGIYRIRNGTFHSTLPAETSVTIVVTDQRVGQKSLVAGYREDRKTLSNPSPDTPVDMDIEAGEKSGDYNSSFVFFVRGSEVLLVRTEARPDQWQPIGGQVENVDVSPLRALVREVHEEIGVSLDASVLSWLGGEPADLGEGMAFFWTAPAEELLDSNLTIDRNEIVELKWWRVHDSAELPMYSGSKRSLQKILSQAKPR